MAKWKDVLLPAGDQLLEEQQENVLAELIEELAQETYWPSKKAIWSGIEEFIAETLHSKLTDECLLDIMYDIKRAWKQAPISCLQFQDCLYVKAPWNPEMPDEMRFYRIVYADNTSVPEDTPEVKYDILQLSAEDRQDMLERSSFKFIKGHQELWADFAETVKQFFVMGMQDTCQYEGKIQLSTELMDTDYEIVAAVHPAQDKSLQFSDRLLDHKRILRHLTLSIADAYAWLKRQRVEYRHVGVLAGHIFKELWGTLYDQHDNHHDSTLPIADFIAKLEANERGRIERLLQHAPTFRQTALSYVERIYVPSKWPIRRPESICKPTIPLLTSHRHSLVIGQEQLPENVVNPGAVQHPRQHGVVIRNRLPQRPVVVMQQPWTHSLDSMPITRRKPAKLGRLTRSIPIESV